MDSLELVELVDTPRERLDVEYKAWLDLNDDETRAKLARHLCALTNYGGGFLVFGINDDMTSSGTCPSNAGHYNQDTLSGIIKRFLRPAFQVTVHEVESALTGVIHPVVWVPPHEAVPVCSVRDGPQQKSGKTTGITMGTYYTRAPGPESEVITKPELWEPIIQRCVIHKRQALLADIESLLRPPGRSVTESDHQLQVWHDAAHRRFLECADVDPQRDQLKHAHYQFSYQLNIADQQELEMPTLYDQLRKMGHEVLDLVDPGWTMFWVFDNQEFAPKAGADDAVGDVEFLECSLLSSEPLELGLPDFWRIAPTGIATLVRPYREDRRDFGSRFKAGTWLWPYIMAREIAELIRHARAFAERFDAVESVSFRAEWHGLKGRTLKDGNDPLISYSGVAEINNRAITKTVPVTFLNHRWTDITAEILSTLMRLFNPRHSIQSQKILKWSEDFRR